MIALLLLACTPEPADFAGCAALSAPDARTLCRLQHLPAERDAILAQADTIADPLERDMLLVELAVSDPRNQGWICKQVHHDYGERQCLQVLGRPHLSTPPKADRPPEPPPRAP
ncbi:MAG: hypothetical protein VX899_11655 [Myxococcota bacterium]|nr:hypothetical protein [Myxococcota bacterium]